ncbi:MAG: uracil phosphoribosyltransferase [Gemmatimonadetes bacterium]|nr:uracil phosphoribosyltransferase [Gemmatimonadota bacterium]MYH52288.1 uracil phosphoribosyltransferase [Gemmatimonadota bacterium]MYK67903.1 uracil phosphoribosyltransferase [Gemmatimonadota bacterium]
MSKSTLHVVHHPLIEHKLSYLRDKRTGSRQFRTLLEEITLLLTFQATRDLRGEEVRVETPLEVTRCHRIREDRLVVVAILRAGLGMVDAVLKLIPGARVGHLGFYRNEETLQPVRYYGKLPPDPEHRTFLLVDPMLGTGGTSVAATSELKERGARDLRLISLVAAPEGVAHMAKAHPDVPIYTAALDRKLNEIGYIVPGLGDAGDRIFGTV